jgi:hypothetical protein
MNPTLIALFLAASPSVPKSVFELSDTLFEETARADLKTLQQFVSGMKKNVETAKSNRALFNPKRDKIYSPDEKTTVLSTWGSLYSYFTVTEGFRQKYWDFVKQPPNSAKHAFGFLVTHTALTAILAHGLAFSELALGNKQLEVLLDEPNDEYGLPKGGFGAFKYKAIHVATLTQLQTGDIWAAAVIKTLKAIKLSGDALAQWAMDVMKANGKEARKSLLKNGPQLFVKNAQDILSQSSAHTLFPVQKYFAELIGDTRVARIGKPLVQTADIETKILPLLQPGDVVVARQNWFLSNIALPGFWPHAELFVGTAAELKKAFDSDAEVIKWTQSQPEKAANFSELIEKRYPDKWKSYSAGVDFQGHGPIRVIESISEGVSFTSVEHAFGVDYLGALRPRLNALDKAKAIEHAFKYQGRPYDFDFDFYSDTSLVCTELVYKSYQPSKENQGITMNLVDVAGRKTLPANEIVKVFDAEGSSEKRQFDFVLFVDCTEKDKKCVSATEQVFKGTHKRLKWDVAQQ